MAGSGWRIARSFDRDIFDAARQEFLSHLRYARGHSPRTCYSYHSDLGIWAAWLVEAGKDWQRVKAQDVEQFAAWQLRDQGAGVHIVARRLSALSSFYKWAAKHEIVTGDPVALADKPKRPHRIPVWLEKDEQQRLEATVKTHLPAMKNACASMGRLIDDLLDYQALEDGRTALHLQRRDPAALTREIQPDLAILARHRSMRLTVRLPDSAPPVLMDPMRIRQVLDNLISNAVKYSRPGSEIHLTLAEEEGAVRWSVADRGVGIAPEDRTRLFQPFVKGLHRSPSGEKSIGLGLALCKRIVEAHRGTIGFEARPDGGTTFTFTLPIPPPSP